MELDDIIYAVGELYLKYRKQQSEIRILTERNDTLEKENAEYRTMEEVAEAPVPGKEGGQDV